jgi:hypothetical protein
VARFANLPFHYIEIGTLLLRTWVALSIILAFLWLFCGFFVSFCGHCGFFVDFASDFRRKSIVLGAEIAIFMRVSYNFGPGVIATMCESYFF